MQLTSVMRGGLDLEVSVVTSRGRDREPVLLDVNPDTLSSYSVADSVNDSSETYDLYFIAGLTEVSNLCGGCAGVGNGLGLSARVGDLPPPLLGEDAGQVLDEHAVTQELRPENVRIGRRPLMLAFCELSLFNQNLYQPPSQREFTAKNLANLNSPWL